MTPANFYTQIVLQPDETDQSKSEHQYGRAAIGNRQYLVRPKGK